MADIPFNRAMRLYVQPLSDVGDVWKVCAEIASGSFSAGNSGPEPAEPGCDRAGAPELRELPNQVRQKPCPARSGKALKSGAEFRRDRGAQKQFFLHP